MTSELEDNFPLAKHFKIVPMLAVNVHTDHRIADAGTIYEVMRVITPTADELGSQGSHARYCFKLMRVSPNSPKILTRLYFRPFDVLNVVIYDETATPTPTIGGTP